MVDASAGPNVSLDLLSKHALSDMLNHDIGEPANDTNIYGESKHDFLRKSNSRKHFLSSSAPETLPIRLRRSL